MKSQDMILGVMRAQGTADALDLRGRAADMDGTPSGRPALRCGTGSRSTS